jgi:hypothetical protein
MLPMAKLKPEIQQFVALADQVREKRNISRATLSKAIFNDRAGVIDHLAKGKGCSVVSFLEAERELRRMDIDPNYTPPKHKPKIKGRERQAVSA